MNEARPARPMQTSLMEGGERAVGPTLHSFHIGDNSALIAAVAPLYLAGSVLDVTYGGGVWWRRFKPETFAGHDLATDGVDFRALPYEADSWDTVCFDPPYVPSRAAHTASAAVKGRFREAYGLKHDSPASRPRAARRRWAHRMHARGAAVGAREVLRLRGKLVDVRARPRAR